MSARALTRAAAGIGSPPPRIVHLGLGAFHRAHQAWFTSHADDAHEWGIAAFTGRSPREAQALAAQDCLYTLTTLDGVRDGVEVIGSIVQAHDSARLDALRGLMARPEVAIVTLTVTEAGYRLRADGRPDEDDRVMLEDGERLRRGEDPLTPLARLVTGLDARRRAGAGGLAVVPCDNVPGNGPWVHAGVRALAVALDPTLAAWIEREVSFVSTSVDRITPRRAEGDDRHARAAGWIDAAPVVTEPFADWVLCGAFPAGRPQWGSAGARFVPEIEPYEHRKLWMLNGAHTVLAELGRLRGHDTVAQAIGDPVCAAAVAQVWDAAARHLPSAVDPDSYRGALAARFRNPGIVHRLDQIAADASVKLAARIVPVAQRELADGRDAAPAAEALAAWIAALRTSSRAPDARAAFIDAALAARDAVAELVAVVDPALASHTPFMTLVRARVDALDPTVAPVAP